MTLKNTSILAAVAATATLAAAAPAELRDSGRALSAAHGDAVLWLSVLSKTNMSVEGEAPAEVKAALAAQAKEEKSEVTGTVIDKDGLIVTALAGLEKGTMVDGQSVQTPLGEIKLKASSEVTEIRVITADGSEIPADLVLRDQDLGLAFVRIRRDSEEARGLEFKAVSLDDSSSAEVLDECVTLGRLDESLSRAPVVLTGEVIGKTSSPRVYYRVSEDSVGCPVFLTNGKLLGVSVLRSPKRLLNPTGQMPLAPVILPAADVAKVADQARRTTAAETEGAAAGQ